MINKLPKNKARRFRQVRVRKKVHGTAERPRLAVFRSIKHVYAQLIDDENGVTLVSASSLDAPLKGEAGLSVKQKAEKVGALAAERALEKGISTVVFDRAGYKYHGRIAALAQAAREKGLNF
ncbi:MAG: 50S ribosomal protein L18 [Vulcanimicrobiota bacterium]